MNASEARELRQRAERVLAASIPPSVVHGSAIQAVLFKDRVEVVSSFVRKGTGADRALLAIVQIEAMQRGADRASLRRTDSAAPQGATPPSNTGVNEGREWLLGSGL